MPWSPSPPSSPSVVALNGLVEQTPLTVDWLPGSSLTSSKLKPALPSVNHHLSEDEFSSLLELEDEHLSPEVLLHIAYEVVSQLDRAEEFCPLSPDEEDLRDFLKDQIVSLQLVVKVQDATVPSMAQDSLALVQVSWLGHCSGPRTQSSCTPPPPPLSGTTS
jgi:hypothetical protein